MVTVNLKLQRRILSAKRRYNNFIKLNKPIPLSLVTFLNRNGGLPNKGVNILGELPEDILHERGLTKIAKENDNDIRVLLNSQEAIDMAQDARNIDDLINKPNIQHKWNLGNNQAYFNTLPFQLVTGDIKPLLPFNKLRKYLRIYADQDIYVTFGAREDSGILTTGIEEVLVKANTPLEFNQICPINAISIHSIVPAVTVNGSIISG